MPHDSQTYACKQTSMGHVRVPLLRSDQRKRHARVWTIKRWRGHVVQCTFVSSCHRHARPRARGGYRLLETQGFLCVVWGGECLRGLTYTQILRKIQTKF